MAGGEESEIHVLHVVNDSDYRRKGLYATGISVSKLREDTFLAMESRLELLAGRVFGTAKVRTMVMWGDPVKDIIQLAKAGNFDLIVMATHGRRGFNRFFAGSITEEVMRRAHCSVLVLRAKAGEAEQARKEEEMATAV
jgi:nucleotide-binding universal stress UspA family protein